MSRLPVLPRFSSPLTNESALEMMVEKLIDKADMALISGAISQESYDEWMRELDTAATRKFYYEI